MTAAQETSYESQIVRYFLNLVSTKGELSCALKSCIAACPSCPPEVLAKLAAEEDLEIRWELSRNPSCPPETLKQMAEDALCAWSHGAEEMEGNSWQTLTLCAGNPACPPDLLAELVEFAENGWGGGRRVRRARRSPKPLVPAGSTRTARDERRVDCAPGGFRKPLVPAGDASGACE